MSTTLQIIPFRVDTTKDKQSANDFTNSAYKTFPTQRNGIQMSCVYGDVVLLAGQFTSTNAEGVTGPLDMTGALAVRSTFFKSRIKGATPYGQRVVYNQGFEPALENLALGFVTWDFNTIHPDLGIALDAAAVAGIGYVDVILECTWLSPTNLPQTLCQLLIRVHAQGDADAAGSPPPFSPDYMDAATALLTFVKLLNYLNPVTVSGGPTLLVSVAGLQVTFVDTSLGDETINLPPSASSDPEYSPLIFNIGPNRVHVVPDAGNPDTINGFAGIQVINTPFGGLRLFNHPVNNNYVAPLFVVP